jgi:hypothetical protein
MNLEAKIPSIRAGADNPNHHLWNNHGTWFLHYTIHPTPFTKERIRRSLGTKDLQVAREQTSLLLALFDEGRATQKQLEETRLAENEKWMALFDARFALDRARLDLLKETGTLVAALRN